MSRPEPTHAPLPAAAGPTPQRPRSARERAFTVGEVLRQVKACLDEQFLPVLVVGEVANARQPRGGHVYFTLRDATASLRVVVYARLAEQLRAPIRDGEELLVQGRITAYPPSGDVQLVADRVEAVGEGAWRARREQLRRRLDAEGLFDPARKRPLPFLPRAIGLVTSPTGAAIRDVLTTLERRFPALRVVVAPVRVSGAGAAPEVARQLRALDARGRVDVILVVRGGGSQEDLAAFDEEQVVRAVAACRTPVVVGVGHETDVTLSDLAADRRAPTPTAAAELAVPVLRELEAELARRERRLRAALAGRLLAARKRLLLAGRAHGLRAPHVLLRGWRDRLEQAERRLAQGAPRARLEGMAARLEQAGARLARSRRELLASPRAELEVQAARLTQAHPAGLLAERTEDLSRDAARLRQAAGELLERRRERLGALAARLEALSPLQVLARGYSLTTDEDGAVVQDAGSLRPGQRVRTRLARGAFLAEVRQVEPTPPPGGSGIVPPEESA